MLNSGQGRGEAGSGMVIGTAILFPILMLVIVVLQMLSDTARAEQGIQSSANRAARLASLCCYRTDEARGAAEAGLRASTSADAYNRIHCNNDVVADSRIVFMDVEGEMVPGDPDQDGDYSPVPPGGTVHVLVSCRLPPLVLGGFGLPGLDVERTVEGVATIDPYRYRAGT